MDYLNYAILGLSDRRASLFDTSVLGQLNLVTLWGNDLADPAAKTLLWGARVLRTAKYLIRAGSSPMPLLRVGIKPAYLGQNAVPSIGHFSVRRCTFFKK